MMVSISVPYYQKRGGEGASSYTAFVIEVNVDGRKYVIDKRYSEFSELHKKLRKSMSTPEFPPKNVFKWHPKILEQRRQMFEVYLQTLVNSKVVPKPLSVFLGLPTCMGDSVSICSSDALSDDYSPSHQAVITFTENMYLSERASGTLPDIVTDGVLRALYQDDT